MSTKYTNVCVVIDYENVHCNLRSEYTNVFERTFFRLRKHLEQKNMKVIDIIAYCNFDLPDLHNSRHQSKLHEFGIETRHTSNNNKNYADIQITVDTMDMIFQNNLIDGIVLISDDKDMTPLIKAVKKQRGFVHLITSSNSGELILQTPTSHSFFDELYTIPASDDNPITEHIYNHLNDHIKREFVDNGKVPPLVSLDRVVENNLGWLKMFEYEIIRHLMKLDTEGKIALHNYRLKNGDGLEYGKSHVGIVTDTYLYLFNEDNPINKVNDTYKKELITSTYKKYMKKA